MTGGCLCGQVRYRVEAAPLFAGHCHCRNCQRASGAGHVTGAGFNKANVAISGDLKVFAIEAESGREIRRFFCSNCGSTIYSESDAGPGVISVYAGTLDNPSAIAPRFALFSRDRPTWDHMSPDITAHHTMPF